mmetsp:Transcript_4480/g.8598  ORF Transcript_4480/g.8598 Transcript_4480/m.8598 type:complete len:936 (-) Transcript_4480:876-3683(-)
MATKRPRTSSIQTKISDRKARRKEERKSKKKKPLNAESANNGDFDLDVHDNPLNDELHKQRLAPKSLGRTKEKDRNTINKKQSLKTEIRSGNHSIYDLVDDETAAAIRNDDEEIALLEKNLGIHKSEKNKKKLNKEYAKLEGYGDDFGDFLDGLDDMLDNLAGNRNYDTSLNDIEYDSDESDPAAARAKFLLRQDEKDDKSRPLFNEDISDNDIDAYGDEDDDSEEEDGEEMVPMKGPSNGKTADKQDSETSDSESESESESESDSDSESEGEEQVNSGSDSEGSSPVDENSDDGSENESFPDHDDQFTYKPVIGQDLYGNVIHRDCDQNKEPSRYVPPHLRRQDNADARNGHLDDDDDPERMDKLRAVQRLLNNNMNRLSDNTLESVAKSIASIYKSAEYSIRDVNEKFWKNMRASCVAPHMIMSTLIPIYMACVAGVHFQVGDKVQLGGFVLEQVVLELWQYLEKARKSSRDVTDGNGDIQSDKEGPNLMLIICYLYNYNIVHCTLMYDIFRHLIQSFDEIDVELLLLILSHCGSQLRSDDPTALKDIVLLVQERSMEVINLNKNGNGTATNVATSSRAQFMISAITDLKNNKKRSADIAIAGKTLHYRKVIGRMKSKSSGLGRESGSSTALRLTVQDILDIETKGRWWVVGATWVGNQQHGENYHLRNLNKAVDIDSKSSMQESKLDKKQQKLLKLAAKQRMNTDLRRNIFCIIMGSDDCQDAFEKLVSGNLLKGKSEREVVRVLVHCCSQEKVYNPYYAHLANRICDYQNKCKFTFQLTLWDYFRQFNDMKPRKAANLAKLLAHLIMELKLNLNVLKTIDISPEGMSDASIIFLTILFSNIFESYEDPASVAELFQRGEPTKEQLLKRATDNLDSDDIVDMNGRQALKQSILIFLLHYLENSPKNVSKSMFRKNLKVAIKTCQEERFDLMI